MVSNLVKFMLKKDGIVEIMLFVSLYLQKIFSIFMKFYFKFFQALFSIFLVFFLASCSAIPKQRIPQLSLLDVYEIPFETQFQETKVGGLSGIDYDKKEDSYYIISDDRSDNDKARIYEAKIKFNNEKIENIAFEKVIYLKNEKQELFESSKINPIKSADPEDVRFNPKTNTIVWSSEGERMMNGETAILQNPSMFEMNKDGKFLESYHLPAILNMNKEEKGPRRNGVLEGLTFNSNFSKLYVNVEEPLYEDGAKADLNSGGIIRFFEFVTKTKRNTNQYFYPIDPIAKAPNPENAFAVNGVSAILMYEKDKFLVVERSYSVGTKACTIKLYSFDLKTAQKNLNKKTILNTKKLVLNLDSLGIFTDNIEGITLGPKLANGDQSLLLISDNNFSKEQITQILLLKIKN